MVSVKNKIIEQLSDERTKNISEILSKLLPDERIVAESMIADMIDEGIVKSSITKTGTLVQLVKNVKEAKVQYEKNSDYEIVTTLPESIGDIEEKTLSTRKVFQNIIAHSQSKLLVSEPFIDNSFVEVCADQLRAASKRGVRMVLLTRKVGLDSSSLKALLRIYEIFSISNPIKCALEVYEHWIPLNIDSDYKKQFVGLHAKLIMNQEEAYLGSANWTEFSLGNNVEIGLLIRDSIMLRKLKGLFELILTQAQKVDMEKTHAMATRRGWK